MKHVEIRDMLVGDSMAAGNLSDDDPIGINTADGVTHATVRTGGHAP